MLTEKALNTIEKHKMLQNGDTVAVALSGGADSMALFHFLCNTREKLGIKVLALHVNHGLREESRQEQEFVADYCAKLGVECIITQLDMNNNEKPQGLSTESWARDLRYRFFAKETEKYSAKLATAHTMSDRAETVLFNLTRGTSLKGAAGIPAVRDGIIRPLIDCSREEIELYCEKHAIPFVTDKTNFEDIYSRNKIRLNVIPQLKKINPAVEAAICSFASDSVEIYSLLEEMSDQLYRNALGLGGLDVDMLKRRHPAVVKNLLRNNLDKLDCLSKDNIEAIYRALSSSQYKRQLSATVFCRIKDGRLSFYSPQKTEKKEGLSYTQIQPGQTVVFGDYTLHFSIISQAEHKNITENSKNYLTYGINYDILKGDVGLRTRKTGDKFTFINRNVTKTLKKLFIEDKVPQGYRDRIPVLVDETDSVIWVGEYGTSQPFVPTDDTKEILLITQM